MKKIALIFAGGTGKRMGKDIPKQFLKIADKEIIIRTIEVFEKSDYIDEIYISCIKDWIDYLNDLLIKFNIKKVKKIVPGGTTGQMSIFNSLNAAYENNKEDEETISDRGNQGTIELSKKESQKIETLKKMIIASVDKKTSMTTVAVTLQNPKVAAVVADSVVGKLQEYIINYRTSKAKEDCIYLERLFKERQQEYYVAQKRYADYMDSHDNIILQSVRAEQERLQNDMSLAYQVYSQVASQLQVARAKVQEEKPVFAVVEPAVVPLNPSGTSKKIYVLAFIFLSVCIVIFWKLFGENILNKFKEI